MKKRFFITLLLVFLITTLSTLALASEAIGTLVKLNKAADWVSGEFVNVEVNPDQSGTLVLKKDANGYPTEGQYRTKVIELTPFNRIVPSWNVITPEDTYIKVDVRFRVQNQWSSYLTMGEWGSNHRRGSASDATDLGSTSIDTIMINAGADALQLQVSFYGNGSATPVLHLLAATAFQTGKDPGVPVTASDGWERNLDVPMRSQMVEDSSVSGRICSPTSLAMVLEYYGINKTTKEIYDLAYDYNADIFGNWPFNTAVAGSFGLEAYVDYYYSITEIKQRIAQGIPVICSIKFKPGQLIGAPISSTSGHLVVVRGFVTRNGQEYVIVNDPAAPNNETVYREYMVEQFVRAWKGWVYIISPRSKQ